MIHHVAVDLSRQKTASRFKFGMQLCPDGVAMLNNRKFNLLLYCFQCEYYFDISQNAERPSISNLISKLDDGERVVEFN